MDSEFLKFLVQAGPAGLALLVGWWLLSQHRSDRKEWRQEHLDERHEWRQDISSESALNREAAARTTDALKSLEVAIRSMTPPK